MDTNDHTVREVYAAFNRGDVEGVLAPLAPDVEWRVAPAIAGGRTAYFGPGDVREFFRLLDALSERHHIDLESVTDVGEHVAVVGRHRILRADGETVAFRFVHTWTLRDGLVTAMSELVDSSALRVPASPS
jgi:ketosteroid isomerase-like protein